MITRPNLSSRKQFFSSFAAVGDLEEVTVGGASLEVGINAKAQGGGGIEIGHSEV